VVVLEVGILSIRDGESAAFEAAFGEARSIIAASPGYQRHDVLVA
jgi:hypothetical protein